MPNQDDINGIISPIFKGERPIYHLITEEKLNELIQNSFIGSVFFAGFSILTGVAITEKNWIYFIIGICLLIASIFFYWQKVQFVRKTKKSGEVRSLEFDAIESNESRFTILSAIYGTPPERTIDISQKLNNMIADNKISFTASNDVAETDPNPGVVKTLDIEYRVGNQVIKKQYKENAVIFLP